MEKTQTKQEFLYDIVFYETFKEEAFAIRKFMNKDWKVLFVNKTIQESPIQILQAPLISIRTQSKIPLNWKNKLAGILSRSTGFDHLEEYCNKCKKQIPSGYLGNYCEKAVAEHAVMLTFILFKKFKQQVNQFNLFLRNNITGQDISENKVLVVGVGNIGQHIVLMLKNLDVYVKGVDLVKKIENLEYTTLKKGIEWANIIICSLPLTSETDNLLNYDMMKNVKKGTLFVNISRGEICPLQDINKLLDEKLLGGVGLDVFPDEKQMASDMRQKINSDSIIQIKKILNHSNSVCTPHNAFNSIASLERKAKLSVEAIDVFKQNGVFPNQINKK